MRRKTRLAAYIAELREEAGLTQLELDEKAELPKGTVAQLESGAKPFSDARIEKLAKAFNLPVRDLLLKSVAAKTSPKPHSIVVDLILGELAYLSEHEQTELLAQLQKRRAVHMLT